MNNYIFRILIVFIFSSQITLAQVTAPFVANPIPDMDINEDDLFNFQLPDSTFSYVDSDVANYNIEYIALPVNSTWIYLADSITLRGIPTHLDTGSHQMTVRLLSAEFAPAIDTFMINVHEVNDYPVSIGSISNQILLEGFLTNEITLQGVFFDEEDSTNLIYAASIVSGTSVSVEFLGSSMKINELGIGKTIVNINVQDQDGGFIDVKITIIVNALNELMTVNTGNTGSSGLVDNKVAEIFKDNVNNIWFGTEYGLSILNTSGEWENLIPKDYFGNPEGFWQNNNGQMHIAYRNAIQTYGDAGWGHYFPSDSINAMAYILASCTDSSYTFWIAGKDQTYENVIIASNNGSGWNQQYSFPETGEVTFIESIGDSIYLGTSTAIYTFDGTNLNALPITLAVGEMPTAITQIMGDSLAISTNYYLYTYSSTAGNKILFGDGVRDVLYKNDKLYAISSYTEQFVVIDQGYFDFYTLPQPISDSLNITVYPTGIYDINDSTLMISGHSGAYVINNLDIPSQNMTHYHTLDGLPSNNIRNMWQLSPDTTWIMTEWGAVQFSNNEWQYLGYNYQPLCQADNGTIWGNYGAIFNEGNVDLITYRNGLWEVFSSSSTGIGRAYSIDDDADGNIWAASDNGLFKYDGTTWAVWTTNNGLNHNEIQLVFVDSKNRIWVEYSHSMPGWESGISMYDGQTWTHIEESDGLIDKSVNSFMDHSSGDIWVSTPQGISIIDSLGNITNLNRGNGLTLDYVEKTVEDSGKNIWVLYDFTQSVGISLIDSAGVVSHFTVDDGLPSNDVKSMLILATSLSNGRVEADNELRMSIGTGSVGIGELNLSSLLGKNSSVGDTVNVTSLEKGIKNNNVNIYPNPSRGVLNIDASTLNESLVVIYDLKGNKHFMTVTNLSEGVIRIDTSHFKPGFYIVKIISKGKSIVKKLVVK